MSHFGSLVNRFFRTPQNWIIGVLLVVIFLLLKRLATVYDRQANALSLVQSSPLSSSVTTQSSLGTVSSERSSRPKIIESDSYKRASTIPKMKRYLEVFPQGEHAEAVKKALDIALENREKRFVELRNMLSAVAPGLVLVDIPEGDLILKSADDKMPNRNVYFKAFQLSKYETTFEQYDVFANETHRVLPVDNGWGRGKHPVINVSWNDAQAYVAWLAEKTGLFFQLPSETQWEYAARAGSEYKYPWGDQITCQDADFNFTECNAYGTSIVGSYPPNQFGLNDVIGNVAEWVQDCRGKYSEVPLDGSPLLVGACEDRVKRGGSWNNLPEYLSLGDGSVTPANLGLYNLGFRVAVEVREGDE